MSDVAGPELERRVRDDLADGGWHRLHPATPLLRGGVALVAILAVVIANLREQLIEWLLPGIPGGSEGDPIGYVVENGYVVFALLGVAGLLIVLIVGFYLSWRMHTFRITDELVEVRSGILFRTHRKGRLDRIQGINVGRPLLARVFGAAKLEINVAGQDANIELQYLGGAKADALRATILRLASGARRADPAAPDAAGSDAAGSDAGRAAGASDPAATAPEGPELPPPAPQASLIDRRLAEFTAPELDPELAEPESIVAMPAGRLVGSTVLSGGAIAFVVFAAAAVVGIVLASTVGVIGAVAGIAFSFVPVVIGTGSYLVNRIVKSLRFTIARTPDGIRVGYGLLSTSNETLPPGRIHSVSVSQPLLWRPFDWWEVKVNRAGTSSAQGAAGRQNTTILPVGTRADAFRVLELVLPALEADEVRTLVGEGLGRGVADDGYATSPRRAAVLRWFSWRRNGFAILPDAVLVRRGAVWRELVIVPAARMQSVSLTQGPLARALRVAVVQPHTVAGPISARLGAIDVADAEAFFRDVAAVGVSAAAADRSQRWGEAPA